MVRQIMTALVAVAGLALWVAQPAQAKDWPNGYDPASGLTWEEDFTYSPSNPYGAPPGAYAQPDFFSNGSKYRSGPGPVVFPQTSYYGYAVSSYAAAPANYSYGALAPREDNMARIRLIVPDGAKVWFDETPTQQSGTVRNFESPALTPGRNFSYDVKVKWLDTDGKMVTRTRRVDVGANSNVTVDFTRTGSGG